MVRAFAVAAFLRALESRVALALEGAFRVDAAAVSTQPEVLTLVNVCTGGGDACGRLNEPFARLALEILTTAAFAV